MTPHLSSVDHLPPRRPLTVADVEAMVASGILGEDERVELIEGALVTMSPKGNHHELLKLKLDRYWQRRAPDHIWLITETTFPLSPTTYLEPDFVIFPRAVGLSGLNPATALLVVEIADTSLGYDLGPKAQLYAGHGVTELWVIDAAGERIHVHRTPGPQGYGSVTTFGPKAQLAPQAAPELALRLTDLDAI